MRSFLAWDGCESRYEESEASVWLTSGEIALRAQGVYESIIVQFMATLASDYSNVFGMRYSAVVVVFKPISMPVQVDSTLQ